MNGDDELILNATTRIVLIEIDRVDQEYNVITTNKIQFKRFMQIELYRKPELESIYPILCSIEKACLDINRLMRRISTDNLSGLNLGGSVNIQGEDQKKLDVVANRIMKIALCCTGEVSLIASEEDDEPCLCSKITDNAAFTGKYTAVFDPLDGSSNIDSGLPTGTIFGIYKALWKFYAENHKDYYGLH
jgi:fructose-1,6-bisphosphatase I